MPFVENSGARICWDEQGSGAPLLLIAGFGWSSSAWHRARPILSKRYRTIAINNRDVSESGALPGASSVAQMASDAAAILTAARVNTAHIFAFAMGGMIALEFALLYPKKVRSLILGGTSLGGPRAVPADPSAAKVIASRDSNFDKWFSALIPFIYDVGTPQQRIQEDLSAVHKSAASKQAYEAQLQAMATWEADSRLAQVNAPTLVIHGERDRIVPAENASLIAEAIPGAKLIIIPRAGHMFMTDQPEAAHTALLEFLSAQATRQSERASAVLER